jgi:hypothetical protein
MVIPSIAHHYNLIVSQVTEPVIHHQCSTGAATTVETCPLPGSGTDFLLLCTGGTAVVSVRFSTVLNNTQKRLVVKKHSKYTNSLLATTS